jgi:hypothetical protein
MKINIKQIRAGNLLWVTGLALAAMIGSQAVVRAQAPFQQWTATANQNVPGSVSGTSAGANFTTSTTDAAGDSASVAIGLTGPSVTVTAIEPYSASNTTLGADAYAEFVYGVSVVNTGGGTAIAVPLVYEDYGTVSANLTATGPFVPGQNYASASLIFGTLVGSGSVTPTDILGRTSIQGDTQLGVVTNSFTALTGTIDVNPSGGPYGAELAVGVEAGSQSANEQGATLSATVDPIFMIDPTFSQAGDYTLEITPGIVPSAHESVPDAASTWALLAMGCAGMLIFVRRRAEA